jgi:hypothetical protein
MSRRMLVGVLVVGVFATLSSYAAARTGRAVTGGVTPYASGYQNIASNPGVYAQTTDEYAGSWSWTQTSASYDYYWYIFTSGGTLSGSGHNASGGGGNWSGTPNVYYFKEYNNEPLGSGRVNKLQVTYCC